MLIHLETQEQAAAESSEGGGQGRAQGENGWSPSLPHKKQLFKTTQGVLSY